MWSSACSSANLQRKLGTHRFYVELLYVDQSGSLIAQKRGEDGIPYKLSHKDFQHYEPRAVRDYPRRLGLRRTEYLQITIFKKKRQYQTCRSQPICWQYHHCYCWSCWYLFIGRIISLRSVFHAEPKRTWRCLNGCILCSFSTCKHQWCDATAICKYFSQLGVYHAIQRA